MINGAVNREKERAYSRAYYAAHRDRRLAYDRARRVAKRAKIYGLTTADYDRMLREQGGYCALCHRLLVGTACVDHDHQSGKIRGLIHRKCNLLLGQADEDARRLRLAATYLDKHRSDEEIPGQKEGVPF